MAIKKVGVVGGGLMGSGIAQTAAQAGYDVLHGRGHPGTAGSWHGARQRRVEDAERSKGQHH